MHTPFHHLSLRAWLGALALLLANAAPAQSLPESALAALQQGGHVLLMRHSQTVSGIGDPPQFKIDDCSTQRNLSQTGRDEAKALGERLRKAGVKFDAVYTSAWCRCVDTASLAFSAQTKTAPQVFAPLNSTFNDRSLQPNRTDELRSKIRAWKGIHNIALVTHMVNIQALTGETLAMNEVVVLKPAPQTKDGFQIVGRLTQ
jgi:phosphohistidine phosphatase SixA